MYVAVDGVKVGMEMSEPRIVRIGMGVVNHTGELAFVREGAYIGDVEYVSVFLSPDALFDGLPFYSDAETVADLADGTSGVFGYPHHGMKVVGHDLLGAEEDTWDVVLEGSEGGGGGKAEWGEVDGGEGGGVFPVGIRRAFNARLI